MPPLLAKMKDEGRDRFYNGDEIVDAAGTMQPYAAPYLILTDLKKDASKVVKKSGGASLVDIGDGVLLLEFHSKMNALGEDAIRMVGTAHKTVQEMGFSGLVVGNQGEHFSAGANLPLILSSGAR